MAHDSSLLTKVKKRLKQKNEEGARRAVIEDLFYDFNTSKSQVFLMNFVRGIFFGLGSVLGGTLFIALIVWALSLFGNLFPALDVFFNALSEPIEQAG